MNNIQPIENSEYIIQIADESHFHLAQTICDEMESSARIRKTGIAKRSPLYIQEKMIEGKAIIAQTKDGKWAGFCYIETWDHGEFVANSGLIIHPEHRKSGLARNIKKRAFELSRKKYPNAKIIGLTTSLAVMKINSDLGYIPVPFSELPKTDEFWKGCSSCVNYDILNRTGRTNCLCTSMKFDPVEVKKNVENGKKPPVWDFIKESKLYEKWMTVKQRILLNREEQKKKVGSLAKEQKETQLMES